MLYGGSLFYLFCTAKFSEAGPAAPYLTYKPLS